MRKPTLILGSIILAALAIGCGADKTEPKKPTATQAEEQQIQKDVEQFERGYNHAVAEIEARSAKINGGEK